MGARDSFSHSIVPPYLGIVTCASTAFARILPEDLDNGVGDVLPGERHRSLFPLRRLVWHHVGCAPRHGRLGVFLAHASASLGGVPEQVLQGKWGTVFALQHQGARRANGGPVSGWDQMRDA